MEASTALKRPASLSPSTEPVTLPKRRRRTATATEPTPGSTSRTPKTSRGVKKKNPLVWDDIPEEWSHDRCLFLELPVELLDKITGSESQLELQDHLALASTCRTLRDAYTEEAWKALIYHARNSGTAPFAMNHIFSSALDATQRQGLQSGNGKKNDQRAFSYREEVAETVNHERMTKTRATQTFKLSEKDLAALKFYQRPSPYARRKGGPTKLFLRSRVRALALRIHGGPLGHAAHLKKRAEIAEKSKATKAKNGTAPKKKDTSWQSAFDAADIDVYFVDVNDEFDGFHDEDFAFFDSDSAYGDIPL